MLVGILKGASSNLIEFGAHERGFKRLRFRFIVVRTSFKTAPKQTQKSAPKITPTQFAIVIHLVLLSREVSVSTGAVLPEPAVELMAIEPPEASNSLGVWEIAFGVNSPKPDRLVTDTQDLGDLLGGHEIRFRGDHFKLSRISLTNRPMIPIHSTALTM